MKNFFFILIFSAGCKEVYNPPVKAVATGYLVVEGNIVAGNDSSFFHLTRTTPVSDTVQTIPESNAAVAVEGDDGSNYTLQFIGNGYYAAAPLNINSNKRYRVHIFTRDGKEYASDFVPVKITPLIDSVSWKFAMDSSVTIYVNTHDATGNTQYYRWNYVATYEHRAFDSSQLVYDDVLGGVRYRTPQEQVYHCWVIDTSGQIFLASTTGLSSDVIYEMPLVKIPYGSQQLSKVYSIIVKQYALTKDAFEFWQNLKKNNESLGTIFDPQPFADYGNMHCLSDASEPVIGFISACSLQQQRIFIYYNQINWLPDQLTCKDTIINNTVLYQNYTWIPIYVEFFKGLHADHPECADCRLDGGGITVKPSYMP